MNKMREIQKERDSGLEEEEEGEVEGEKEWENKTTNRR